MEHTTTKTLIEKVKEWLVFISVVGIVVFVGTNVMGKVKKETNTQLLLKRERRNAWIEGLIIGAAILYIIAKLNGWCF